MTILEELRFELKIAQRSKRNQPEIEKLEYLIKLEEEKNNDKNHNLDNINYPYGKRIF
jgi:hypothetical protein